MNDYVTNLTLDINCGKNTPTIDSAQFDKGRVFSVAITADGEPFSVSGCEATLKCVHSDKSSTSLDCSEGISVNGTEVTVTLREDTLPVRGLTAAKLVFTDGTRNYSTQIFLIDVDSSLDGTFDQDLEKAKSLMAEAGYENGFDLTCTVPSNYLIHVNTAVELASELKAIGINLEIKQVDWGTWLEQVYKGRQYETTVIALTSSYAPYDVLERYQSTSDGNFINYSNSEVDKLMAQIPLTADNDERTELYHQVLGLLTADACSVYLQDPTTITAVSTRLEGYHVYPMYVQDMSQVKLAGN